jgi:hypothetical protein
VRLLVAVGLVAVASGCSDDGFDALFCGDGEVFIEGESDGDAISDSRQSFTSYSFINALGDSDGELMIGFAGGDQLYLTWPELTANGGTVSARGYVDFSPGGGVNLGNCDTGGFVSTLVIDGDGDGGTFRLTDLRPDPYCTSTPVVGELRGCYRNEP